MDDSGNGRYSGVVVAWIPARTRWTLLAALAVAFFGIGMVQAGRQAPTVDEGVDLSSGVAILVRHDLRMVPEHGPLPRALAALPALLANPIIPDSEAWRDGDWFDWSDEFIAANDRAGRLDDVLLLARIVPLLEGIGCAALVYALARRPFGPDGGLLAAAAWLTTPYLVGLAATAMIDVPFTLATLGTCLLLARWWERPTLGRAAALGSGLGAALCTRHTAVVLVVVAIGVIGFRLRADVRAAVRSAGLAGVGSVVVTWAVYRGLDPSGPSGAVAARFEALGTRLSGGSLPYRLVGAVPMPAEWKAGLGYLDLTSTDRPSSLLGQSWDGGQWWYFPASAVLKLPLMLVAGIVAGWVLAGRWAVGRRALLATVAGPGLVLWLALVAQPLNLGLRMAMPVVALAYVGLGGLVLALPRPSQMRADPDRSTGVGSGRAWGHGVRTRVALGVVSVIVAAQVVTLVVSSSAPLAWTQPPWRPAYRWVSDSNLDAGQAFFEVRDWADENRAWVAFDRTRGLELGYEARSLVDAAPAEVRGWVAVGVTPLMQTRREELAWLRKYCPVGSLGGGSVLTYRFVDPPDPSPGPERPVAPCWGAAASTRAD